MNKHLSDGHLRAALDGELNAEERRHLDACRACQERQKALELQVQRTAQKLAFLAPQAEDRVPPVPTALRHFYDRKVTPKESPMFKKMFASPLLRFGLPVVLVLALIVSVPATRALADQLLDLFRVQQVDVVPVDMTGMQQLTGNDAIGKQVSQLLSSSTTVVQKPGQPVDATDAAQASQLAGFTVRVPQGMTPSRISVTSEAAYAFTVDRAKAQALLNEAGRSDLVLPASIDGAKISVNIPSGVSVDFGDCPAPSSEEGFGVGTPGRQYPDCVILVEIPSPTVSAPASVDVAQLAQIGLQFTGMTSEQAVAFTHSVDWTSTLVVPIPKNAATYQQVSVDGVTGTLIQRPADDAPQYALLWVKDGTIYTIGGLGTNSQQAIQMANSLH